MDKTPQGSGATGKRGLLKWPLLVSLAVNLFLAGVLGGHIYSEGFGHFLKRERPPMAVVKDLSEDSRAIVRAAFKERSPTLRALGREMREERRRVEGLLSADPFDEAATRASMQEMARIDSQIRAEFQAAALVIAAQLPADEREKFARFLKRDHRSGMGGRSGGHRRGDGGSHSGRTAQPTP